MWPFIMQQATAVVDSTSAFSPLLIGLVSVVWLAAAMIFCFALHHFLAQKTEPRTEPTPVPAEDRAAA